VSSRYETASLHSDPRGGVIMKRAVERYWVSALVCVVLLLCFSVACQDKAAMAEVEKYKAQAGVEEQNKELARNFFAAIDKNDFARLKELSSAGFSFREPGVAEPISLDAIIQVIRTHYAAFPDWKHTIEDIIAEGNIVAIKLLQNGTHKAPYEGILPTDKKVTMPALFFMVVANGKIKGGWAIEDYLGFYQQLGMELRPKEAKR
jgi:predicted ester cyclase